MHCAGRISLLWGCPGSTCRQLGSGTADNSLRMKQISLSVAATITRRDAGRARSGGAAIDDVLLQRQTISCSVCTRGRGSGRRALSGGEGACGRVAVASGRRVFEHNANSLFGDLGSGSFQYHLLVLLRALPRKASHHGRCRHTLRHDARAHEQLAMAALAVGERLGEGEAGAAAAQKQKR